MSFYRDLSIRGKIVSTVLFIAALEVIIALMGVGFLRTTSSQVTRIAEVDARKIRLAGHVNVNLLEIHRAQKNLILALDPEDIEAYTERLHQHKAALAQDLDALARLTETDELPWIAQFRTDYEAFLKVNDEIESIMRGQWERLSAGRQIDSGQTGLLSLNAQAIELSKGRGRSTYDRAVNSMNAIASQADASLEESRAVSERSFNLALLLMALLSSISILAGVTVGLLVSGSISSRLRAMVDVANAIAGGHFKNTIEATSGDEVGRLSKSLSTMQTALLKAAEEAAARDWLKTGVARLNDAMRGRLDVQDLSTHAVREIATYLHAQVGALYMVDGPDTSPMLKFAAGFACAGLPTGLHPGEGLLGQSMIEKRSLLVEDLPEHYLRVESSLGTSPPRSICITPLLHDGRVNGAIELGFLDPPTPLGLEYLDQISAAVAVNVETALNRERLAGALKRSQTLTEELQAQQEELRATNEELEEQTQLLEESQQKLMAQQEEIESANLELREKNESLERQKRDIERSNRELETARREIEVKAEDLIVASRYKSEFLANMSHELRTPLNSMLLLARFLTDNREGNLTEEQVKSASIIAKSGNDLLALINDVLDLSKIEAGRMELHVTSFSVRQLAEGLRADFQHMAEDKHLQMQVLVSEGCPEVISTDRRRIDQVLKNLVSNAIKFTEAGSVTVRFTGARPGAVPTGSTLAGHEELLVISVSDTGIGIPQEKQRIIFEAFEQVEYGTAKRFGGTGLGLSISRELTRRLGGEIHMVSQEGRGSVFTVVLPVHAHRSAEHPPLVQPVAGPEPREAAPAARMRPALHDDRNRLQPDDRIILVVEDDTTFAGLMYAYCREKGFKCLLAADGEEGLRLAREILPHGIILDIRLPGMDGWAVLEALKQDPETRHIPVHIISVEDARVEGLQRGAIGYLTKPVAKEELDAALTNLEEVFSRKMKDLLVVEDDDHLRVGIRRLLEGEDVRIREAVTGAEAIEALENGRFDCMILDLKLPDMSGFALLESLRDRQVPLPPVIVYTGSELTREDELELRKYSESVIIKGARSEERLLDETSLFLHRMVGRAQKRKAREDVDRHDPDALFKNRRILIVDDDMRNVFALSRVLEEKGMRLYKAENGLRALQILEQHPDMDLVLMDIMMPVLDGYETMRKIRAQERFGKLPIIALTAKAMRQDRECCIEAGASDYLPKPVDLSRLFSMLRVWLYQKPGVQGASER